jgi:hypothetical protein
MNRQHQPDHSKSIRPTLMPQKTSPCHHLLTDFFYESPDTISVIEQLTYQAEVYDFDPDEWIDHISTNNMRPIINQLLLKPYLAQQELLKNLRETYEESGDPKEQAPSINHQAIKQEEPNESCYLGDRDPHSQPKLNWGIFKT